MSIRATRSDPVPRGTAPAATSRRGLDDGLAERVGPLQRSPRVVEQRSRLHAAFGTTVQRMTVLNKPAMTGDFIELTSIDYALKRGGPPFALFPQADFSILKPEDSLYFVAHGRVGESGDVPTPDLLRRLTDRRLGLRQAIREIVFTSCYAGKGRKADDSDSVVSTLQAALRPRFPQVEIRGARGPSVKSSQTGDAFTVIDTSKTIALPGGLGMMSAAVAMQHLFVAYYGPDFLAQKAVAERPGHSVAERAEAASQATGHFYREFQNSLQDPPGSITLSHLRAGSWAFEQGEYAGLSSRMDLPAHRQLTPAEVRQIAQAIQAHATLVLPNPMNAVTT